MILITDYKEYLKSKDYQTAEYCASLIAMLAVLALIWLWVSICPVDIFAPDMIREQYETQKT